MNRDTICVQGGYTPGNGEPRQIPIIQSTTFKYATSEDMGKLFKDFVRLDLNKNRNVEGTGLGLALTYRLVRLMGGDIKVDSIYGAGSTFTILLPQGVVGSECIGNFTEQHRRRLVRRSHLMTIVAAWVITVPISALLSAAAWGWLRPAI